MKRVLVVGCPGAGKSTFARALRKHTGLRLYYLDQIWHRPDRTNISREEFDARLEEIVKKECWIIDGNYQRTLAVRLERCDTVFFLDYPLEICLAGAAARVGTLHEDLPWREEEFDPEFRQWIEDFPRLQRPQLCGLLEAFRAERQIVTFRTRTEADDFLQKLDKNR